MYCIIFKEKSERTHLNLLLIEYPPNRRKVSKRLGGNTGCRDKNSSWHLIGFPNGSGMGSTA